MRLNPRFAALTFCILFAGCRGTGGGGMVPSLGQSSKLSGSASFSIAVPPAAPGATRSMQSVVVTLLAVNGASPTTAIAPVKMNLSANTPGCSLTPSSTLTCTASIAVPPGRDTFTVTTYAQPNSAGTQVSSDQVTTSISAGRSTTCVKKNSVSITGSKTAPAVKS